MSLSVYDAIATRRAVRNYTDKPVSEKVIEKIVTQALEAPSAFNAQARDLVVVRDQEIKNKLVAASGQPHFATAPVILVAVGRAEILPADATTFLPATLIPIIENFNGAKTPQQLREAALRDALLMAGFALLAATAEGLATGPATGWDEEKVKEALGIGGRDDRVIGLVMTLGYSAESPAHPGREQSRRINDHY